MLMILEHGDPTYSRESKLFCFLALSISRSWGSCSFGTLEKPNVFLFKNESRAKYVDPPHTVLLLSHRAADDWKMKLAAFMLLINSAASINLKYISKRNSGMAGSFGHLQPHFWPRTELDELWESCVIAVVVLWLNLVEWWQCGMQYVVDSLHHKIDHREDTRLLIQLIKK